MVHLDLLEPYVPRLAVEWLRDHDTRTHRRITGTLAFVDISGFTALTERLARKGHVGAEEMSDALNATFGHLLTVADRQGADLVKWGGDAILLMFSGAGHAQRGCRAAYDMRARLREVGHLVTTAGRIDLKMSVGVHSGEFDYFLVGDPQLHRELLVTGPAASETARLEGVAVAGQIVVSDATAQLLDDRALGDWVDPRGRLLRRAPESYPQPPGQATLQAVPPLDLGQVLPAAIRDHLLAGPSTPEHRTIAVAFVQFAGTDDLLRTEGPEATAAALDDCIRNVSHAAVNHGVTFFETDINVDGGKIMLTAGAPRTAGHDADRLLRTARRILDHQGRLPLRIGVNTGHVFSGDFGPAFRRTYSVKGDAINLAARIMGKAGSGELLATLAAYEHAETRFDATPVGPFTLKGKAQAVHAVALGQMAGNQPRPDSRSSPLVGRESEMSVLYDALAATRKGSGGVVQLLGEPGIGKSRLMEELAHSADDVPSWAIVCDEYQTATPYAAFRELMRALFGISERTPDATAAGIVSRRVAEVAPELGDLVPLIGDVLGIEMAPTEATAELDDEFRKRRLESVVLAVLRGLLPSATLVTVDDAQHMDPASSDLLTKMAAETPRHPWLLVISRRDQPVGWVPDEDLASVELRVSPLSAEDSMRLAVAAAGGESLPRPALAALADKADGNPLFLQSLVSRAGPSGTVESLPESIEEVLAAQIDQLSVAQRTVLRHAAVLGSQFTVKELAALLPELPVDLEDELEHSLADFLVSGHSRGELRFRHGLIREVAYQGLAYRARRRMHGQVGSALESSGADSIPELLSFHFLHAGQYEKAWTYARTAGEQAKRKYANTEATELLGRAVEASRRLPRGTVPDGEVGLVLEALGDCWFTIGLTDAAAGSYRQAHRHLRADRHGSARLVAKLATVDQRLRKFPQAMRRLSRELRAFEGVGGVEAHQTRSTLQRCYSNSRYNQGRLDDAITWCAQAVVEAESSGDAETRGKAYANLHLYHLVAGRSSHNELGTRALEAYAEADDLAGQAQCTNNLALAAHGEDRWAEAATMFQRAADLYRRIGDTDNEGVALCNRAEVLVNQGLCQQALPLLGEALAIARSVSDDELVALVLAQEGRARARTGDPTTALAVLEEARALFESIDELDQLVGVDVAIAEAVLLAGQVDDALRRTAELLGREDLGELEADVHGLRGFALLEVGRDDEAIEEFRRGVAAGQDTGNSLGRAVGCLGLARAEVDGAPAWLDQGSTALRDLGVMGVAVLDRPLLESVAR